MKKLCIAIFSVLMSSAYALPIGNPSEASLFYQETCIEESPCDFLRVGIGFYGDYVFNRKMETVHDKDIDNTKLFTNAGCLVLNFYERVNVFTTLGISRLSLNTSLGAFNAIDPHPLFEIESGSAFSYSAGARATLFRYKCASFGFMGQYFLTKPNIKRMYIASGAVSYPDEVLRTRYSEWQVAAGISFRYNEYFVPYAAVKYAHSHWKLDNGRRFIIESNTNTFLHNLRNQREWGYAVGLTFCPFTCEKMAITIEARFPDETAFHINALMLF